ncbi:MAG TPA: pentapeptide repeat-containing protein [Candidatus Limnocylindrales bacterium]|nr:pentapeptide repeat-containing protein [Candidatus Limnocylindrales bacterium]
MADKQLIHKLKHLNAGQWEKWRDGNAEVNLDLNGADLTGIRLAHFNLSNAHLNNAKLDGAVLSWANLENAVLTSASFQGVEATQANLNNASCFMTTFTNSSLVGAEFVGAGLEGALCRSADFRSVNLYDGDLSGTDFTAANLRGANLSHCHLVDTILDRADLTTSCVYGIAVWDVSLVGTIQHDLNIAPEDAPAIRVDNLEVAQFIYLLLNNQKVRHVIDTITSKVVLILGRFTPERKTILDALRRRDYLPVLFDFEKPSNRDITETVSTLAHMAKFVIADITDAKSIPQELMAIVPALPSVPVQPLLLASQREYGMFEHFKRYPWVLPPHVYQDQDSLLASLESHVIGPAEAKAKVQTGK